MLYLHIILTTYIFLFIFIIGYSILSKKFTFQTNNTISVIKNLKLKDVLLSVLLSLLFLCLIKYFSFYGLVAMILSVFAPECVLLLGSTDRILVLLMEGLKQSDSNESKNVPAGESSSSSSNNNPKGFYLPKDEDLVPGTSHALHPFFTNTDNILKTTRNFYSRFATTEYSSDIVKYRDTLNNGLLKVAHNCGVFASYNVKSMNREDIENKLKQVEQGIRLVNLFGTRLWDTILEEKRLEFAGDRNRLAQLELSYRINKKSFDDSCNTLRDAFDAKSERVKRYLDNKK